MLHSYLFSIGIFKHNRTTKPHSAQSEKSYVAFLSCVFLQEYTVLVKPLSVGLSLQLLAISFEIIGQHPIACTTTGAEYQSQLIG